MKYLSILTQTPHQQVSALYISAQPTTKMQFGVVTAIHGRRAAELGRAGGSQVSIDASIVEADRILITTITARKMSSFSLISCSICFQILLLCLQLTLDEWPS